MIESLCRVLKLTAAALAVVLAAPATATQVTLDAVPGGLVEIPLVPLEQPRPPAEFGRERLLVMPFGGQWVALVGLPLDLVPGNYIIQARPEGADAPLIQEFSVFPRRTRRPAVVELANPPPEPGIIEFEWRDTLDAAFPLAPPVSAPARPLFGSYRQVSETQSGHVDFVTFPVSADTPVTAPGKGRIALVSSSDNGAFVWIDHGMGLYSRVGPLTHASGRVNDPVESGQAVGAVLLDEEEQSGALYWSVYLNGAAVDPFLVSRLRPATSSD